MSAIKIDVEGYEMRVLRGAAELLARDRPVIFGEFGEDWARVRGEDPRPLLAELFDSGYDVFALEWSRSRPWRPLDLVRRRALTRGELADDLLFVPRDLATSAASG